MNVSNKTKICVLTGLEEGKREKKNQNVNYRNLQISYDTETVVAVDDIIIITKSSKKNYVRKKNGLS